MTTDIAQWLERHGLGQYLQAFADNDIDLRALTCLSEEDLKELGLSLGHRRIVQAALGQREVLPRDADTPRSGAPSGSAPPTAEHRQLTVLFCDIVDSTGLARRLDPEDMRDLLRGYQEACAAVVARFGGYVAKYMGDGVYAYFGYPTAHEDDAERAINAGLGIVEAMVQRGADPVAGDRVAVRIGITTGNVAVGDLIGEGASEEANVVGTAPNLAARLQAVAAPDTVVIGEATHALAGGLFETRFMGTQPFKGFPEPIEVWTVVRARPTESRFEVIRGQHLTELVGRDEEMATLRRRWRRACDGEGQIVLISGEPGIGKSRLAHALQNTIGGETHLRLRYQCSPHHTASALYPVIERLERSAGFEAGDEPEDRFAKIEQMFAASGIAFDGAAPLIASLLAIPAAGLYPPPELTPQRQKELTLDTLVAEIVSLSRRQPLLLVFEDAHWIDPTTQEFLDMVVDRVPDAPILMIVTHRPEYQAPWIGRQRVTSMVLRRLERRECAAMVDSFADRLAVADELRERIVDQADGIPLFVEELTNALATGEPHDGAARVLDGGTGALPVDIPATLQDSLAARLDGLGPARELAQVASCIGRHFSRRLLAAMKIVSEDALDRALSDMVASGLFYPERQREGSGYAFKHFLIQQAAYASLLRSARERIHGDIAAALIAEHEQDGTVDPFGVARHLQAAGQTADAVSWYREAAARAAGVGSVREAMDILGRALDLVETLPGSDDDRRRVELGLLTAKLPISIAITGWASEDANLTCERALDLAIALGDKTAESAILFQTATMHEVRGEYSQTQAVLARRYRILDDPLPPEPAVESGELMACSNFYQGRFDTSIEYASRALDLADPEKQSVLGLTLSEDPTIACLFWLAKSLLLQGRIDEAHARHREAFDRADRSPHWYARSQAEVDAALLGAFKRDFDFALDNAERAIASSARVGLAYREAVASLIRQWCRTVGFGDNPDLDRLMANLDTFRQAGALIGYGFYLGLTAEIHAKAGVHDRSDELVSEGLRYCERSRGFFFESELCRLRGQSLLRGAGPAALADAESWYRRGLKIARSQGARLFELRGANALAELWLDSGEADRARDLLAPLYDRFAEGFAAPDLRQAQALLERPG